ncbi:hypothetical protein ADL04_35575 [Streptomyces sp. NRRL B-3648]|nr:hypothetical protein ADL04_35575 [Streptomyces sp. NRRL B-3648]
MTVATAPGALPISRRIRLRSWSRICPTMPAAAQRAMKLQKVRQGGKSLGRADHLHPVSTTYRIASTISRWGCFSGRPPIRVSQAGVGSSGSISTHSSPQVSEG